MVSCMQQELSKERKIALFEFLIIQGLERINKIHDERYVARAKHEFDRMVEKDYVNYFLCTWEFVRWAKKNNIQVGPGRGSCGASLVAYCLNITEVNPIEYKLSFARFLSPQRRDAPDIDLDFQDSRRNEIFEHLRNKYGADNCAKVVTYSRWHPKGIMRDMGRIFDIPLPEVEKICGLVIERSGGDARASFGLTDTFSEFEEAKEFKAKYPMAAEIAMKLEGHIRHKGQHAAAMIVTQKDIATFAPIHKVSGELVDEWEKQLAEDIICVK